jgi:hypothetical protein
MLIIRGVSVSTKNRDAASFGGTELSSVRMSRYPYCYVRGRFEVGEGCHVGGIETRAFRSVVHC